MNNETQYSILRILLVLIALGVAAFLAFRIPKLIFSSPVAKGDSKCGEDKDYHYKDPQNHPYDC